MSIETDWQRARLIARAKRWRQLYLDNAAHARAAGDEPRAQNFDADAALWDTKIARLERAQSA